MFAGRRRLLPYSGLTAALMSHAARQGWAGTESFLRVATRTGETVLAVEGARENRLDDEGESSDCMLSARPVVRRGRCSGNCALSDAAGGEPWFIVRGR